MCSERNGRRLLKITNLKKIQPSQAKGRYGRVVSFEMHLAVFAAEHVHKPLRFTPHCVRIFSLLLSRAYLPDLALPLSVPYKPWFLDYVCL